ncbi:hypothetical protein BDV25DRAFT_147702 [Aspergillus avenaceus]|uniref:NAD(P)-binding protein n=1 Tax=Aspergillus avenaceus TaxID=36643 RepID=A0A5N6U762_ASPAV|nr:hypothetical protein BDV25DRAFT_147702 [Aspergillus avenaceus]
MNVLVVTGCGGMGMAIARRLGSGTQVILADFSQIELDKGVKSLREEGHSVEGVPVDVSDLDAVKGLAQYASERGPISVIAHTAGVAMNQAVPERIYQVDLLGTANMIQAFHAVATRGTSFVTISSAAGNGIEGFVSSKLEYHLATASLDSLLRHPELDTTFNPKTEREAQNIRLNAYAVAKRGNNLRVEAAAPAWAKRHARINSVSPGVVMSTMTQQELEGPGAHLLRRSIGRTLVGRIGTPTDVANAVAFLCSPDATFMTGSNLLVDGGLTAEERWGKKGFKAKM